MKIGDRIKIIGNTNHHNYQINGIYTIVSIRGNDQYQARDGTGWKGNILRKMDFIQYICNEKEIKKNIKKNKRKIIKLKYFGNKITKLLTKLKIRKMKVGDRIKLIANSNGHNYQLNKIYVIISGGGGQFQARDPESGWVGNNITQADAVLYAYTKEEIEKDIKNYEDKIHKDKMKLEYMTEENKTELDETEFIAWYLVKIMESTDPRKKEKICKVLNSMTNNINVESLF